MWRDSESDQDFLNFTELADQIVTLVHNPAMLPISIGVFGTWGTGKSTVLRLVETRLPRPGQHLVVKFDAWLYQGFDDARAALMEVVATALLELANEKKGFVGKAVELLDRVNYFRALGLVSDFGASMALGIPPGLLTRGVGAITSIFGGHGNADDVSTLKEGAKEAVATGGGLLKPGEKKTPPKEIAAFRKGFGDLLDGLDTTLILFIDNLDRCLPDAAIGTLEAVRLFLFMPRTAFVIAADEDMIRHSVAKHFKDPEASHVRDYLDKVIQVPLRVPQVGTEDLRAYMYSLFVGLAAPTALSAVQQRLLKALQAAWSGDTFDKEQIAGLAGNPDNLLDSLAIADRLAPILARAPSIQGNPRIVKRLLNSIVLRQQLAKRREMNVDLATLAKLAIFERCTNDDATRSLYRLVTDNHESEKYLLPAEKVEGTAPEWPETWKKFEPFIREWQNMEPFFNADIDLKAAVFLSRDVMAPALPRSGISTAAKEALGVLLKVTSLNSPTAQQLITTLTSEDRSMVMSSLIDTMRQADWSKTVAGMHGAMLMAKDSPLLSDSLKAFAAGLPKGGMDKAMGYLLKKLLEPT